MFVLNNLTLNLKVNFFNNLIATIYYGFYFRDIYYHLVNGSGDALEYLNQIANIFNSNLERECGSNCVLPSDSNIIVNVEVNNFDLSLNYDTDESYSLEINTKGRGSKLNIFTILKKMT